MSGGLGRDTTIEGCVVELRLNRVGQVCEGKGYSVWTPIPNTHTRAIVTFSSEFARSRARHDVWDSEETFRTVQFDC
jgi:hypothetical protein